MSARYIVLIFMILTMVLTLFTFIMTIKNIAKDNKRAKLNKKKQKEKANKKDDKLDNIDNINTVESKVDMAKTDSIELDEKIENLIDEKIEQVKKDVILQMYSEILDKLFRNDSIIANSINNQPTQTVTEDAVKVEEEPKPIKEEYFETVVDDSLKEEDKQFPSLETVDDAVIFSSKKNVTLQEKYDELTSLQKSFYNDIKEYALNVVEGAKVIENNKYEEVKLGNNKIVKLEIKRNSIIANLMFIDANLRKYSRDNKIAIKPKPMPVKIESEKDVEFVKDSINIIIKDIEEDILYKKELQKEKRKQKAMQNKLKQN